MNKNVYTVFYNKARLILWQHLQKKSQSQTLNSNLVCSEQYIISKIKNSVKRSDVTGNTFEWWLLGENNVI